MNANTLSRILCLLVLAVPAIAQPNFECQTPVPFALSTTPDCELLTATAGGGFAGAPFIDATPSCGFPTQGAQYLVVPASNANIIGAPPAGGPVVHPLDPGYNEVQVPIPGTVLNVSLRWDFFNAEGGPQPTWNDGASIDIVDSATGLSIVNLVYVDTNSPLAPGGCTVTPGGLDTNTAGPETLCVSLPVLPPTAYLSISCWNGGDDAVSSAFWVDDITWNVACPAPPWQVNSAESSLDINGVLLSNPFAGPANTDLINGATGTATLATSATGAGFELAISLEPAYPSNTLPGFTTPGGQQVNFNLGTATFLNGGAGISFLPHPGSITFNFTLPTGAVACGQQGVLSPANPDGFVLSQCSQATGLMANCVNSPTATNTGAGDDTFYQHTFAGGMFPFYGVSYPDCFVNSNGNITLGTGDADFTETEAEFLANAPRISPLWDDHSPNAGGQVNVEETAGIFTATWFTVPEFGMAGTSSTFCATLDVLTGMITIGIDDTTLSGNADGLIGISPGNGLSAPMNADLSAGPIAALGASDAIYEDFVLGAFGTMDMAFTLHTYTPSGIGAGPYIKL